MINESNPATARDLTPDNTLHYQVEGAGPTVVLIAGLGGLGEFWQPIVGILAQSYKVITFDHPGIGRSPLRDGYTISGIASDVCRLLDHLAINTAHVVGHSTGGLVAQTLALDYPARVGRVVISGSWARSDRRMRSLFEVRRMILEQLGPEIYKALSDLISCPGDWYETNITRGERLGFGISSEVNVKAIAARIHMLLAFDRAQELMHITALVLVVGATDDQIIPFYHSQELARLIPRARLGEIAGGHLFPLVHPGQYVSALQRHFEFT